MRFALVSNVLPPDDNSHAAVIYRLLRDLDPGRYCLLSSGHGAAPGSASAGRLPAAYYYLPPAPQLTRGYRMGLRWVRDRVNFGVGVAARARAIAGILRRERCEAVVVCTGGHEILDFPAAFLASRMTGARFYAYLLDQYGHMVAHVLGEHVFARLEPMLLKGAAAVIAPNGFQRDAVLRRHNVDVVVIHNPCDLAAYGGPASDPPSVNLAASHDRERRIVYTGSVGPLHYEPFRTLLAAMVRLDRADLRLHIYTAQPQARLETEGIRGPVVFHPPQPLAAMPAIQQQADLLFLPLALQSRHPETVATAAPGKMGEYLAAGPPILVHAPPDSFLASYFRDHHCGLVVDRTDPAALAAAVESGLTDAGLRVRLRASAWERAQADFNLADAQRQFARVIGLD